MKSIKVQFNCCKGLIFAAIIDRPIMRNTMLFRWNAINMHHNVYSYIKFLSIITLKCFKNQAFWYRFVILEMVVKK